MARLRLISVQGDRIVQWDQEKAAQGDLEAIAAVQEAERIFNEARAKGATAFKVEKNAPGQRVDTFDPKAEDMIVVPRMVGG